MSLRSCESCGNCPMKLLEGVVAAARPKDTAISPHRWELIVTLDNVKQCCPPVRWALRDMGRSRAHETSTIRKNNSRLLPKVLYSFGESLKGASKVVLIFGGTPQFFPGTHKAVQIEDNRILDPPIGCFGVSTDGRICIP